MAKRCIRDLSALVEVPLHRFVSIGDSETLGVVAGQGERLVRDHREEDHLITISGG
jgi:hypothetical protein